MAPPRSELQSNSIRPTWSNFLTKFFFPGFLSKSILTETFALMSFIRIVSVTGDILRERERELMAVVHSRYLLKSKTEFEHIKVFGDSCFFYV